MREFTNSKPATVPRLLASCKIKTLIPVESSCLLGEDKVTIICESKFVKETIIVNKCNL